MLLWFLAAAAAPAQDYRCDSIKTDDLMACAEAKWERADGALNRQWKSMTHSPELVKAQRAWLSYRDAECEVENPASPQGREYPIHKLLCWARMTDERAKQLREIASL
jgi:uncharacterized protein YecT (DUF1311 family)